MRDGAVTAAFDSEIRKTIFHFYREQILTNNIFPYIIIIAVLGIWNNAGVAQLVEQLIRNQQVSGSSPLTSSRGLSRMILKGLFWYSGGGIFDERVYRRRISGTDIGRSER